jgi:hypothetical protein
MTEAFDSPPASIRRRQARSAHWKSRAIIAARVSTQIRPHGGGWELPCMYGLFPPWL